MSLIRFLAETLAPRQRRGRRITRESSKAVAQRKVYAQRRAAGDCVHTGCNLRAIPGRSRCERHRVMVKASQQKG